MPDSAVSIRRAVPADADTIVDFNDRLAWESEGKRLDRERLAPGVARVLSDPSLGAYFVAVDDGRIIGQVMTTFEWSDWRNGMIWWIQSVYVEPDHRRQGVFQRLFAHLDTLARADTHVVGLRLYVESQNLSAQATYRKMGLRDAGYFVMERFY
jgi:GNAT superfamily N-acetyltransferase